MKPKIQHQEAHERHTTPKSAQAQGSNKFSITTAIQDLQNDYKEIDML